MSSHFSLLKLLVVAMMETEDSKLKVGPSPKLTHIRKQEDIMQK